MSELRDQSLHERVERLEEAVAELQRTLGQSNEASPWKAPAETGKTSAAPQNPPRSEPAKIREAVLPQSHKSPKPRPQVFSAWKSESWLKIIGIGLFLLGIVFLFKYSIDQGWLTEPVRVGLGMGLGTILFATGICVHARRRSFSQVLLGGGIAAYYITGFSAFQLYALVSHPVAFAFMIIVTLLSFFLSLRQDEAVLSIIGAVGGLGTPFLLYTGSGNLPGLVGYTCLVLSGTSAIYLYRGWHSLLWTSVVGGWLVFLTGIESIPFYLQEAIRDRWFLQVGILFGWLAFWALPIMREILRTVNPTRWPLPSLPDWISENFRNLVDRHAHLLSVSTPLIALGLSRTIWSLSSETWGWITMAGSLVYGLVAWGLKRWDGCRRLAYTHALVSLLLLTIAFCLLLEGEILFFTLAAEATVLHFISRRLDDRGTSLSAHLLFAGIVLVLAGRLLTMEVEGAPVFTSSALTNLAVIAAVLGSSIALRTPEERLTYRLAFHVVLLGWFLRELSALEGGQGYVSIVWGVYAITLLVVGLRRNLDQLRMAAMGTLLLVVGKLFMVDLARLEAIWRILLFLGFGGVFLALSYFFQSLWRNESTSTGKTP